MAAGPGTAGPGMEGPGMEGPGTEGAARGREAALEVRWGRQALPPHAPEPGWAVRRPAPCTGRSDRERKAGCAAGGCQGSAAGEGKEQGTDDGIRE